MAKPEFKTDEEKEQAYIEKYKVELTTTYPKVSYVYFWGNVYDCIEEFIRCYGQLTKPVFYNKEKKEVYFLDVQYKKNLSEKDAR